MTMNLEPFVELSGRTKIPNFVDANKTMNFKKQNSWSVSRGAETQTLLIQTGINSNELSLQSYLKAALLEDINAFLPFGNGYIQRRETFLQFT